MSNLIQQHMKMLFACNHIAGNTSTFNCLPEECRFLALILTAKSLKALLKLQIQNSMPVPVADHLAVGRALQTIEIRFILVTNK